MTTFQRAYEYLLNPENEGRDAPEELFFPEDLAAHGKVGLKVAFMPRNGRSWTANFKEGYSSREVVTGVFPTPSDTTVCVIAQGQGYLIDVVNPKSWSHVGVFPIVSVSESESEGLLVCADQTRLGAVSKDGSQWVTERLASDELRIVQVNGPIVILEGWKADEGRHIRVNFDLRSRKVIQAASSE